MPNKSTGWLGSVGCDSLRDEMYMDVKCWEIIYGNILYGDEMYGDITYGGVSSLNRDTGFDSVTARL